MSSQKKVVLKYLLWQEMDSDHLLDMLAVMRVEAHDCDVLDMQMNEEN